MVEEITAEEVRSRLDGGGIQVVDIRPEPAFEAGHIPGAENVPFDRFASEVDERRWDDEATVANLEGGYRAWEYELVSETGGSGADR